MPGVATCELDRPTSPVVPSFAPVPSGDGARGFVHVGVLRAGASRIPPGSRGRCPDGRGRRATCALNPRWHDAPADRHLSTFRG